MVKHVVNDNFGTKAASDFSLHVKTGGTDVTGSPQPGDELGTTYTLSAGTYTVSEDAVSGYTQSFSGSCDSGGQITLQAGDAKTCTLTNDDVAAAVSADLSITKADAPDPVVVGNPLTYTLNVENFGPDSAGGVVVTDLLPSGVAFQSATTDQGSCGQSSGTVTCDLGPLDSGAFVTITIVVEPQAPGALNNSASISSSTADPNTENNSALATTSVQECPTLGSAIDDDGLVTGEQWVVCSSSTANGVVGSLTPVLPPSGGHEALMTSGDVSVANPPNDSSGAGRDNGTSARGAFDVSILRLDLSIPAGANCLSFELAFQTEEYPEFVNSAYNDGFIAELDTSDWNVSGSTISAPHNFAFDNGGHIVSVNSSFFDPGQVVVATGTQYDGSTPLLSVQTPVTPGLHSLYLSIFDASDHILDSGAFVDGLKAGHVAEGSCKPGAGERGDLKVIKHVVNDDGGAKSAADFTLHVKTGGTDVDGSPQPGDESGTTYSLPAGVTYTVSEDAASGYTQTFSGDCDSQGNVPVPASQSMTCTVTNNDVPPPPPPPPPPPRHRHRHLRHPAATATTATERRCTDREGGQRHDPGAGRRVRLHAHGAERGRGNRRERGRHRRSREPARARLGSLGLCPERDQRRHDPRGVRARRPPRDRWQHPHDLDPGQGRLLVRLRGHLGERLGRRDRQHQRRGCDLRRRRLRLVQRPRRERQALRPREPGHARRASGDDPEHGSRELDDA